MNLLLLTTFSICISGCVTVKMPYVGDKTPKYAPPRNYTEFQYDNFKTETIQEYGRETQNYLSWRIVLTTPAANGQKSQTTKAEYLQSKIPGKKKMVIITPIYGSSGFPPQTLAHTLTHWNPDADYNVVLLSDRKELFDWKSIYDVENEEEFKKEITKAVESTIEAVRDIRRIIDWTEQRPEIDQKRIGVAGFSIGAITASLAMGVDERIRAGALATVAGDPAYILAYSEAKFIAKPRRIILKRLGWTQDTLFEKIKPRMQVIDPIFYAKHLNPERILIIEALYDTYLPQETRQNLWLSLGRPERIILPHSHKAFYLFSGTIFGLNYLYRTMAGFFNERL